MGLFDWFTETNISENGGVKVYCPELNEDSLIENEIIKYNETPNLRDKLLNSQYKDGFWNSMFTKEGKRGERELYIGYKYLTGIGEELDLYKAQEFFEKAYEKGNPHVISPLSHLLYREGDYEQAINILNGWKLDMNNPGGHLGSWGLIVLALCYQKGHGVAENSVIAKKLFENAAVKNNKFAQYEMARYYLGMYDNTYDVDMAMDYLDKSASQGMGVAAFTLACLILNTYKGDKEYEKFAFEIFSNLANCDYFLAYKYMEKCYQEGIGVPQDSFKANMCKNQYDNEKKRERNEMFQGAAEFAETVALGALIGAYEARRY